MNARVREVLITALVDYRGNDENARRALVFEMQDAIAHLRAAGFSWEAIAALFAKAGRPIPPDVLREDYADAQVAILEQRMAELTDRYSRLAEFIIEKVADVRGSVRQSVENGIADAVRTANAAAAAQSTVRRPAPELRPAPKPAAAPTKKPRPKKWSAGEGAMLLAEHIDLRILKRVLPKSPKK